MGKGPIVMYLRRHHGHCVACKRPIIHSDRCESCKRKPR